MCRWQVKPCNPLVTHGPYLSALAKVLPHNKTLYKSPDYIRHVVIMIIMNIIIIMFIIMMLVITMLAVLVFILAVVMIIIAA